MPILKATPTLKQLRHLSVLAEFLHFGKAAEACLITQASLSASIKELETIVGRVLVERTKRSVEMTPLGVQVVERARHVLVQVDDIVDLVASHNKPLSGPLRLGVIPTIAPFLLPRMMPALRQDFPDLKLYLREAHSLDILNDLKAGDLDIALLAFPFATGNLETYVFAEDPLWLAFNNEKQHLKREFIEVADIEIENLMMLEDDHCLRGHSLAALEKAEYSSQNVFQATSLNTLVQMVENGLGETILPKMAIDGGILRGTNLSARPIVGNSISRQIGFAWRNSSSRNEEFRLLGKLFQAELATPISRARKPTL